MMQMGDAAAPSQPVGDAPPPLPGLGAALLNMPLQELMQHAAGAGALPMAMPLALPAAGAAPDGSSTPPRKKTQRGSVAKASEREPTKGTTTSSNRPLSSKFRGVCWNRKNKRWQAAINSGGKYLYLGSFIDEDEAAMAFDRAAIKLRGRKGKLNFSYEGYVDDNGNLKEDIQLPEGAKEGGGGGGGGGGRGGSKRKGKDGSGSDTAAAAAGGGGPPGMVDTGAGAAIVGGAAASTSGMGAGGAAGGLFNSSLANLSMADVKRLFQNSMGAPQLLGGAAEGRGVTTGFTGMLPNPASAPGASAFGPPASAFAVAAGIGSSNGLGPDLPLQLPTVSLPAGVDGAAAQQMPQQQGLAPELLAAFGPPGNAGWQELLQQFRPCIELELGQGRFIQQLVDPPSVPAGANGVGSLIKGVVYTQQPAASNGDAMYGAALWDGSKLVDHGTKGSLEAALETASSLAAGEEDLQGDAALRDLLGGPSSLVPRAASLALFQALGSLRERDIPGLEAAAKAAAALDARAAVGASAGAEGARPGLPTGQQKRGRGAAGSSGSGGGSGAHKPGKRARRGVQEGEEEGGQVLDQQQPQYEMHEQVGQPRQQAGFGGATADALQRGAANTAAFASTSMLAKTQLADMLKNLAAMQQQL